MSGFRTDIPALKDGRDLPSPRHSHGISGDIHNDQTVSGCRQCFNHSILPVRKAKSGAVRAAMERARKLQNTEGEEREP